MAKQTKTPTSGLAAEIGKAVVDALAQAEAARVAKASGPRMSWTAYGTPLGSGKSLLPTVLDSAGDGPIQKNADGTAESGIATAFRKAVEDLPKTTGKS